MKIVLSIPKGVFALLLALFLGMGTAYAHDFSAVCSTGQTLYYNIIDATNHYVEITCPGANTSIPWDGFTKPTGNITLPSTVTYNGVTYTVTKIGYCAFHGCSGLVGTLTIPNTVVSIRGHAFSGCSGFTGSLSIPNAVLIIDQYAFAACNGFTSLSLGDGVEIIGFRAFNMCEGFAGNLTIPDANPVQINSYAFYGCSFTGTLTIGTNVISIGTNAFGDCTGFTQVKYYAVNCSDVTADTKPFENCGGTLTIGSGVQRMPTHMFNGSAFTSVTYNATNCADVTSTAKPFEGCGGTLTIGSSVQRIPAYMFSECSGFTGSLTIPNSVTTIGERAFELCEGFDGNLTLGNSVTTIGAYAFDECYNFTGSLYIPNSVTTIGDYAFNWCIGFDGGLHIGNGVTTIGEGAFSDCSGFWSTLNVGNNVVTIGRYAFSGCTGFGNVMLPRSLTTIGNYAFSGCTGFNQVDIDNVSQNLTSIGNRAFYGCSGLTRVDYDGSFSDWCGISFGDPYSNPLFYAHNLYLDVGTSSVNYQLVNDLVIPEGVTVIKEYAFERATCLTSLTIGSSVTSIEADAFDYCTGLTTMTVRPETPPTLGQAAFNNVPTTIPVYVPCESYSTYHTTAGWSNFTNMHTSACDPLTYSINPDGVSVTVTGHVEGYAAMGELYIPAVKTINGVTYNVTAIGASAFRDYSGLTGTLLIPNSVTSIGNWAFRGCSGFTGTLTIPASVTSIGDNAFQDCTGFDGYLIFSTGVTSIGNYAFQDCNGFTGPLTIPNSVTSIGNYAFNGCDGFNGSLLLSTSLITIGQYAFSGCSGFTGSLTLQSAVTTIGQYAFSDCSGFEGGLNIGSGVTSIGQGAFKNCSSCWTINYNAVNCANITTAVRPFEGCTATTLTIGNSVQRIPNNMFNGCSNFTGSLTIPNSVTSIGTGAFRNCTGFSGSLTLGSSVTSLGTDAFCNCPGFTGSLLLPESMTTIGNYAFGYCSGFSGMLTIPSTVTNIGNYAFRNCSGFTSMTVLPDTPPTMGTSPFQSVPTSIPVYVPCASLEDYQAASGWSVFTNIQCIPETLTVHDGTVTNGFVPVYGYWADAYLKAEFVMPASELADMAGGTITSMKFYASQADVSWGNANFQVFLTEVADATISAFAGPGTVVYQGALSIVGGEMTVDFTTPYQYNGGNLLVGIYNTVKGSWATSTWYGESVTGASVQGYSSSSLSAVSPTQRNFIPKTTFGYTPSECSRPIDLNETDITISSATLQWTGYQDSYDLRYRKKPLFFEDFENGLPSGWTTIDNDGDGYDWHSESNYSSSFCHSGNGIMVSASYIYEDNTNIALTPDNWLITPLLDLQGTMKVWIRAYHTNYTQEHFAIYLSTTGNSVSEFTTVLVPETTLTNVVYHAYTADLSAYAGQQGYIAIRHFNCTDMYELLVDDFGLFEDPNGTDGWETLSDIGSGYTLTALEPETEYEWQVRGRDCDGEGSYTEWSAVNVFTTEALCAPEDQCELTFTLTDSYGDGWNGAAINVVDVQTDILLASLSAPNHGLSNTSTTDTYTLAVCDGRELRFEWVSGSWDSECSYTVTSSSGYVVFSGSGAMSGPVTYMVNCDAVDQTVALSSGYNWFSANVEITLEDLQAALVAALPGTTITINSQGDGSTTYNGVRWRGTLTSLDLSQMYMINVTANSEITLEGTPVNPAEHPATIHPDFNWMAFPLRQSMTLTEAFTGFVVNGDMVTSQDEGSSTYTNRWRGSLNALEPGKGYMYKSSVSEDRVLSFGHAYVDLGLPSGLLWATCNVGAFSPEDYGDYFAWGETTPKDNYGWSTYQYCNGSSTTLTKYCTNADFGNNGYVDNLTTLLPEDDAATANWGPDWRMPTYEEWQELYNNTTVTWTTQNGVSGRLFTAANGNSLFLPAAGYRGGSSLYYAGSYGYYWSSSLYTDGPYYAWYFTFNSGYPYMGYDIRGYGRSVRPVRSASQN